MKFRKNKILEKEVDNVGVTIILKKGSTEMSFVWPGGNKEDFLKKIDRGVGMFLPTGQAVSKYQLLSTDPIILKTI